MGSPSHFDETMPSVQHQVSVHLLVRVKPNFVQAKLDSSFIREIEQSSSISFVGMSALIWAARKRDRRRAGLVEQQPPSTSFLWRSARMLGVAIGINAARTPI
jgi:hypothetical protein